MSTYSENFDDGCEARRGDALNTSMNASIDSTLSPSSRRSVSADKGRVTSAQHADQTTLNEIADITAQLVPEQENVSLLYALADRLKSLLTENPIKSGKIKSAILRSLFRLLDMKDSRLLIKLAHIILLVRNFFEKAA